MYPGKERGVRGQSGWVSHVGDGGGAEDDPVADRSIEDGLMTAPALLRRHT